METIESLNRNIANFRKDTLDVEQFLTGTLVSYNFFKNQYPDILKKFDEQPRDSEEIEGLKIFENLYLKISNYESDIHTFCFINLIARTEAFLNDVLETLYLWKDESLTTDKTSDIENFDESKSASIEKKILKFSHSSFKDKIKFLKNSFDLSFPLIEKYNSEIIELFSTRNIILNNNGYVNATYLKINEDSKFELGTKRTISKDYLKLTFVLLILIAKSVEEQIKQQMTTASR